MNKHHEKIVINLVVDIAEVQTLGGIVLLGRDFNARIATLLDIIDDFCELLRTFEFVETEQPCTMAKCQNRDDSVSGWGRELLDLCSSSMVRRLVTNQGSSPAWQMKGIVCRLYCWLICSLESYYTSR
jgi:hypothetical protein